MFLTGLIQHLVKTPQTRLGHRTISASPPEKLRSQTLRQTVVVAWVPPS